MYAHNTIETIRELTDGKPIHAVMGGTHLITASRERIGKTIDALGRIGMDRFGPAHCTGLAALVELWKAFPDSAFRAGLRCMRTKRKRRTDNCRIKIKHLRRRGCTFLDDYRIHA